MAGHSKFKNIMHRKGAQDKKRAKLFSRLIREISVSANANKNAGENEPTNAESATHFILCLGIYLILLNPIGAISMVVTITLSEPN